MTKQEFAKFAMALKTYYPKEGLLPNPQAMELWFFQLEDIPYQLAEIALNKWVATNKWPPTIADIRESAASVSYGEKPMWSDGWEQVQRAIRTYGTSNATAALDSMDEITAATVRRLGWRDLCLSKDPVPDRANFRMIFEQLAERQQKQQQIPVTLHQLIEGVQRKELGSQKLLKGD